MYLRRHKHLLLQRDHHFLDKDASFFLHHPIENVLNWEQRIIIGLTKEKDKQTRNIRGYFANLPTTQLSPPDEMTKKKGEQKITRCNPTYSPLFQRKSN